MRLIPSAEMSLLPSVPQRQNSAAASKTTMATIGLARTRSLRRPQATGLSGATSKPSSTAPSTASSTASKTSMASPSTRILPPPPRTTRAIPSAAPATASSAPARPRPPPAAGGASSRLRRPEPASPASQATSASTAASRTVKPPSTSRTRLFGPSTPPITPTPGTTRRPSSSNGRPSSSGGSSASHGEARVAETPARGHGRTQSTSSVLKSAASQRAASPTRRIQSIQPVRPTRNPIASAPVLRPPSAQSAQSSSGGSSAGTSRTAGTRAAARARAATITAPARASNRTQKEAPAGRPRTRDGDAPGRPVFSTLQQHFSPAKNTAPKPRVAAILAPPASPSKKPANVALSAETTRLQTHLLQLHVLHRNAADVSAEWHASARHVLIDTRFAALAADYAELVQITAKRAESANAAALQDWASFREDNGMTLEEKIQALDEVLAGVWSLAGDSHYLRHSQPSHPSSAASTSRYAQVVRRFEQWAQQTAAQVEARQGIKCLGDLDDLSDDEGSGPQGIAGLLLSNEKEPLLDASWHEECGQLARRLQGWQRQLDVLGRGVLDTNTSSAAVKADKEAQPSLLRMLAGCTGLVEGMLEELRAMQQLAREAAEQELAWVRRMNAAAAAVSSDGQNEEGNDARQARAGAIWRTV